MTTKILTIEQEKAHIETTIKGLQEKLLQLDEPYADPPECIHCGEPLVTVYLQTTCTQFEAHEAEWDGREERWKIDWDEPSNQDTNGHVSVTTCGSCEKELPYEGSNTEEWIDPTKTVPTPEETEPEEMDHDYLADLKEALEQGSISDLWQILREMGILDAD